MYYYSWKVLEMLRYDIKVKAINSEKEKGKTDL